MMIVGVLDPTNMESTTTTTAATTIMTTSITAVMIMTSTRTTRVDTRVTMVEVEMAVEVSLQREISVRLNVSSVRRWGIMQMSAQKRKLKEPPSPTLSRRDK